MGSPMTLIILPRVSGPNRDHDGVASVVDHLASDQTLGTVHSDGSDGVLSQVLSDLQDELGRPVLHLQSVEDLGESILELHVNDSTDDRHHLTLGKSSCW